MARSARFGSVVCAIVFVASAALIGVAGSAALAQTPGTAGPITFNLFTGDSVVLNPKEAQRLIDAARKAQAPGQCPLGRLTFYSSERDPLFQEATAAARRDAVLQYLNGQGIDASRFFADAAFVKDGKRNDVELDLNAGRDQTAPTLDVTWTPPKGTKVKANQRITAKAVARDDTNRWQSGINTIDLDVQGGGPFGFQDYPRPQPPCANPPPPRTLEGVYTVPSDPPPIVRLRAVTKDFAGHDARDIAEFPTGDWYGHIDWSFRHPTGRLWGRLDVTFDYDGHGNLKGRMAGDEHTEARWEPCRLTSQTPAKLSANLVGQYTPGRNTMSLRAIDQHGEQGRYSLDCASASGVPFGGVGPLYQPGLAQLLNSLTVRADGSVEASGEGPATPASAHATLHLKLTLRRIQD